MLEETLGSIEKTSHLPKSEQFKWTIPSWPLKYMLENSNEENKIKLENAIKNGRIIPHALPLTYETEASDEENLVRGLNFNSSINRRYGLPLSREAKLTDVPSHSRVLPTVLKNAGIDILHIGCNPGSTAPDVPPLFWWQGPDGSKLLTFYWAEYYGSGILPPKDWKHKTWMAMIFTHENSGAPTPDEVAKVLREAKEKMPNARIKIGRISDFYDLLIKEDPTLPVITGDMPDTWIHGYMSMPRETKLSKKLQRETYNTEILNTQMNQWLGTNNSVESYVDEAVENMILYDEHTFGIAMTHGDQHKWTYNDDFKINKSLGNYDFIEASWNEKGNRIRKAERIIVPLMMRQMKNLAASMAIEGKRIVVYNPLPWSRSGNVNFFAGIYQKDFEIFGLKDVNSGKIIPVYNDYNLISFEAEDVPSLGYKAYIPILTPIKKESSLIVDQKNHILENKFFKLKIDPTTGALSSVYDKKNKKELVDPQSEAGFAQYYYEQFGQEDLDSYNKAYVKPGAERWANQEMGRPSVPFKTTKSYTGKSDKIVYLNMGNSVRATVFGKINTSDEQNYLVTYTLYENQPYVEIVWGIDGKKPNALPEAGWLSFPFAVENPEYRLNRTGGIVDPQRELVDRTNHDFYFLNTSMAMFDKSGSGIALNSPSSPGISIDNPGLYKFSKKKKLTTGKVFINLFNSQWGTNFTEWIEGSFSSKIYIWSYKNYDAERTFITPSEETRVPLKAVFYDGAKGTTPAIQEGITLSRKGILVTAFGENRDGEGQILRFWEETGESGNCTVGLPRGSNFRRAFACNLRGEITDKKGVSISNDTFQFMIKAYQPVSFILK
jgi:alpha-mannosidase